MTMRRLKAKLPAGDKCDNCGGEGVVPTTMPCPTCAHQRSTMAILRDVRQLLRLRTTRTGHRFMITEREFQERLAQLFNEAGLPFVRED